MRKLLQIIIGNVLLGLLILLTLVPFNLSPTLAASPPRATDGEKVLSYSDQSILTNGEGVQEDVHTITTQSATFVINYNPAGNCVVDSSSGLPNFIPNITPTMWPAGSQAAFEHALSIWSMVLDANQTIVVNACWAVRPTDSILGTGQPVSAYANFSGAPIADTLYAAALANELAGSDLNDSDGDDHDSDGNPADAEITMSFNGHANIDWYFGTDANPGSGEVDFVTLPCPP